MKKTPLHPIALCCLFACLVLVAGCSAKINSIPLTSAFPDATLENILSAFQAPAFTFSESRAYKGSELITGVSPDGMSSLQVVVSGEDVLAARSLIYLSIDASAEYANAQNEHLILLISTIFGDSWPAKEWIITATNSIAQRNAASLMGGASVTTERETGAGIVPVSLYVRLDENNQGLVMGVVIGDWLDDISYDPAKNVWEP